MHQRKRRRIGHVDGLIPAIGWVRSYRRDLLRADVSAGFTVAVLLIPQSMAYATLAGLPPQAGLYAAIVSLVVYAALGTSRYISVAPVAIDSLLVAAAVGPIAQGDTAFYVAAAGLLAVLTGLLQLAMGVLRLGALVNFLSIPVISGFTSAAAVTIAATQVKDLLGVTAEGGSELPRHHRRNLGGDRLGERYDRRDRGHRHRRARAGPAMGTTTSRGAARRRGRDRPGRDTPARPTRRARLGQRAGRTSDSAAARGGSRPRGTAGARRRGHRCHLLPGKHQHGEGVRRQDETADSPRTRSWWPSARRMWRPGCSAASP
ncbi:MAG: SulP family inorganic anion transporter [Geodermatophilaceae bacterium]